VKLEKSEMTCSSTLPDLTNISIALPGDVTQVLEKGWGDLSEYALEIFALEAYRSGVLTPEQLHRILSLRTRPSLLRLHADCGSAENALKNQRSKQHSKKRLGGGRKRRSLETRKP
jgi:hypothetical protein